MARSASPIGPRMSASRATRAFLVVMVTGCLNRASTFRISRVIMQLALDRLVGVGVGRRSGSARTGSPACDSSFSSSRAASGLKNSLVSKSSPGDRPM